MKQNNNPGLWKTQLCCGKVGKKSKSKQTRMPTEVVLFHQENSAHKSVVAMAAKSGLWRVINWFKTTVMKINTQHELCAGEFSWWSSTTFVGVPLCFDLIFSKCLSKVGSFKKEFSKHQKRITLMLMSNFTAVAFLLLRLRTFWMLLDICVSSLIVWEVHDNFWTTFYTWPWNMDFISRHNSDLILQKAAPGLCVYTHAVLWQTRAQLAALRFALLCQLFQGLLYSNRNFTYKYEWQNGIPFFFLKCMYILRFFRVIRWFRIPPIRLLWSISYCSVNYCLQGITKTKIGR